MVIKGKGFAMNRDGNNMFSFALPEGLVPGAGISDTIEFYRIIDVQNDDIINYIIVFQRQKKMLLQRLD